MFTVRYGDVDGREVQLEFDDQLLAVRTRSRHLVSDATPEGSELTAAARAIVERLEPVMQVAEAGVEVLRDTQPAGDAESLDRARRILKQEPDVEFAGRVLVDTKSHAPVLYTENFFIKFRQSASEEQRHAILQSYGLIEKREIEYAENAVFAAAPEGTGTAVFEIAQRLLAEDMVELCQPELVRDARDGDEIAL